MLEGIYVRQYDFKTGRTAYRYRFVPAIQPERAKNKINRGWGNCESPLVQSFENILSCDRNLIINLKLIITVLGPQDHKIKYFLSYSKYFITLH